MNQIICSYHSDDKTRKAEVMHDIPSGLFYVNYYLNDKLFLGEYYPGKSVHWASDCAENYALGIKNFDMEYFNYLDNVNERKIDSPHEGS